jgi:hypothetical protein
MQITPHLFTETPPPAPHLPCISSITSSMSRPAMTPSLAVLLLVLALNAHCGCSLQIHDTTGPSKYGGGRIASSGYQELL